VHFKSFYLENIREREREDVSKHARRLLSDSEPLDNTAINFGCAPVKPIEKLGLGPRGNMVGLHPNHGGLLP